MVVILCALLQQERSLWVLLRIRRLLKSNWMTRFKCSLTIEAKGETIEQKGWESWCSMRFWSSFAYKNSCQIWSIRALLQFWPFSSLETIYSHQPILDWEAVSSPFNLFSDPSFSLNKNQLNVNNYQWNHQATALSICILTEFAIALNYLWCR